MSVSSVEEHQDLHRQCCSGPECGGRSRLLSFVTCSSPPPLLSPSQCSVHLSSSFDLRGQSGQRVSGLYQEPSLHTITSVQSGSSHNRFEEAGDSKTFLWHSDKSEFPGSWKNSTKKVICDNQCSHTNEIPPYMYNTGDSETYTIGANETWETLEETFDLEKSVVVPQTEYIVVDIPLQLGMGSPYSSSCFILIDR